MSDESVAQPADPKNPWQAPESFSAPTPPAVAWQPMTSPGPDLAAQTSDATYAISAMSQLPERTQGPTWGLGQVWLGLGIALGLNLVVSIIAMVLWVTTHLDSVTANASELTSQILNDLVGSPWFVLASLLTLWVGFLTGVYVASYRRGQRSLALDFGWRIVWRTDIIFGILLAVALRCADAGFGWLLQSAGVDPNSVDNSKPILDQKGIGLILVVLAASIGAPMVEELFFRGLTLRALQKRWGAVVGIIGSSVLFGLLHAQPDASGALGFSSMWLVLFTGSLGAVLAIVAVKTKRLGITVTAHITFNASALILGLLLK